MKKKVKERDRISGLADPILHHILSFLSQKEAVATCVLSKSWRHVVSTRPNLEFRRRFFKRDPQKLMSFLDKTLGRYHDDHDDRNLSIHNFLLEMSLEDIAESISLLEKWIPIVLLNMHVHTFTLRFYSNTFDLSSSLVFKAESLRKLVLHGCKLTQYPLDQKILLKHLQTLSLTKVDVTDETFQNIISSCPLIGSVKLDTCQGFKSIKLNKAYNLKRFDFFHHEYLRNGDNVSIEIDDVPAIETITIFGSLNWYDHYHNYFPHLKTLDLFLVQLSKESLHTLSCNFPCLEVLNLSYCISGFEELRISSRSIKHLRIGCHKSIEVAINASNILEFDYNGMIPQSISFTTNSSDWRSNISLRPDEDFHHDVSSWLRKLREMLKAVSQSEIFLCLDKDIPGVSQHGYGEFIKPVYVGHLTLRLNGRLSSPSSALIDNLLCICRPRSIFPYWYVDPNIWALNRERKKLTVLMWKILVMEIEKWDYVWQQDLEEVSMEVNDENGRKWHPVVGTSLTKCAALLPNNLDRPHVRFLLNWRKSS